MKIISEAEREFLRNVLNHSEGFLAGESLVGDLFDSDGIALFFLEDGRCCLFSGPDENEKTYAARQRLFNLMALMNDLERENMICCLDREKRNALYMSSQDTSVAVNVKGYSLDGYVIEEDQGTFTIKTTLGKPVMQGNMLQQSLADTLRHYIDGRAYATSRLQEFVNNDFKSVETLRYEKEISYARKSLRVSWAAFVVAILSVIVTVPISNEWGESTIKAEQFEKLEKRIDGIKNEIELSNSKLDSVIAASRREKIDTCCHMQSK